MNRTHWIIGGTCSVVSLAVGGAVGYFLARKKFNEQLDLGIAVELEKAKKHYSILLMQASSGKPDSPADIPKTEVPATEPETSDEDETEKLSEKDRVAVARSRQILAEDAKKALVDYQGISQRQELDGDKPPLKELTNNIFADRPRTKTLPPRDPTTGHFVRSADTIKAKPEPTPYIISHDDFLKNEFDFEQENLKYFKKEDTLLDFGNEVIDNARIGEVNLTLFPDEEPSIICIRNEGLRIDYEVQLTHESLTEYMGLGEEDPEDDDDDEDPDFEELDMDTQSRIIEAGRYQD